MSSLEHMDSFINTKNMISPFCHVYFLPINSPEKSQTSQKLVRLRYNSFFFNWFKIHNRFCTYPRHKKLYLYMFLFSFRWLIRNPREQRTFRPIYSREISGESRLQQRAGLTRWFVREDSLFPANVSWNSAVCPCILDDPWLFCGLAMKLLYLIESNCICGKHYSTFRYYMFCIVLIILVTMQLVIVTLIILFLSKVTFDNFYYRFNYWT